MSGATSDKEWQRVTKSENEWQRVTAIGQFRNFFFYFWIREEPTTNHPKENYLNPEEDVE